MRGLGMDLPKKRMFRSWMYLLSVQYWLLPHGLLEDAAMVSLAAWMTTTFISPLATDISRLFLLRLV